MKNYRVRIFAAALSVCVGVNPFMSFASAKDEAEKQKQEIQSDINELDGDISSMKSEVSNIESIITELDSQYAKLTANYQELTVQLEAKQGDIDVTQVELDAAKKDEEKQYEDMKKRIRYMYENGNGALIEVILQAESISDFLNKAEYVTQISEYDRDMLVKYQETKAAIETLEAQLQQEKTDLETVHAEVAANREEVSATIEAKSVEIANYESSISEAELEKISYAKELALQDQIIQKLKEQEKRVAAEAKAAETAASHTASTQTSDTQKQTQSTTETSASTEMDTSSKITTAGTSTSTNTGTTTNSSADRASGSSGLIWPATSYYVTSGYGERESPLEGASTYHGGIDIGATDGSPIFAAASGSIIGAGYEATMGYYIFIDHGNGLTTVYMHASALYVSVGQTVSAGDTIAAVGSTGNSTGPHLHFEVRINSVRQDPTGYF